MDTPLLQQSIEAELPELCSQDARDLTVHAPEAVLESRLEMQGAEQQSGTQKTFGEKVTALVLIGPTVVNWFVLAGAHWIGTAELVDSQGVHHAIPYSRSSNFAAIYTIGSIASGSTFLAHVWLSAGALARRYQLDKLGTHGGVGYEARLHFAGAKAAELSNAEWAHIVLVAFDASFATWVFWSALPNMFARAMVGLAPGPVLVLVACCVLAPARGAVLRKQRTNAVAFVGRALRVSLGMVMVQIVVLGRCVSARTISYSAIMIFHPPTLGGVAGLRRSQWTTP